MSLPERIAEKLEVGDCWQWTGAKFSNGYGATSAGRFRRSLLAHRYVYELLVGEIPEGLEIDHLCKNRACCNPDHLEPVTSAENSRRSITFGGAHRHKYIGTERICVRGHVGQYSTTKRPYCVACDRERIRS